jgi:MFS family permease
MHNAPGGAQCAQNSHSAARLVLLVTASVCINYIDRGNLATAAPLMQDELQLSASQLGVLLSAFYYGYVICMPGMGWLAERYGAKRVLAAGVLCGAHRSATSHRITPTTSSYRGCRSIW